MTHKKLTDKQFANICDNCDFNTIGLCERARIYFDFASVYFDASRKTDDKMYFENVFGD